MSTCARTREHLAELVRGDAPEEVRAHATGCAACQALVSGGAAVRADLDAWTVPAPPDDLVERALARMALAGGGGGDDLPLPTPLPAPTSPRRRTSVELLTSSALGVGADIIPLVPPTRRQLVVRLFVQAAAALVMFGVCTTFVAVFYPAVTHALEQRRLGACQEHLKKVGEAIRRYRQERPDAPPLRGAELRHALVEGGYLDPRHLECAGPRGRDLGANSFVAELPPADPAAPATLPPGRPVAWDRFGNHAEGFNVVYGDGRVEVVSVEGLARWMQRASDE